MSTAPHSTSPDSDDSEDSVGPLVSASWRYGKNTSRRRGGGKKRCFSGVATMTRIPSEANDVPASCVDASKTRAHPSVRSARHAQDKWVGAGSPATVCDVLDEGRSPATVCDLSDGGHSDEGLGTSPTEVYSPHRRWCAPSAPLTAKLCDGASEAVSDDPSSPPRVTTTDASHRRLHFDSPARATPPQSPASASVPTPIVASDVFTRLRCETMAELASAHFNAALSVLAEGMSPDAVETAAEHYEHAVALGHTKAKVNLAQLYFAWSKIAAGTDDDDNDAEAECAARHARAKRLLNEACHERDSVALAFVGAAYRTGSSLLGVPKDRVRAGRILRAAAEMGDPDGMLQLSLLLSSTGGHDEEAFDLCCRAAPYRIAAQRRLSQLYRDGRGVPRDARLARLYRDTARFNAASIDSKHTESVKSY